MLVTDIESLSGLRKANGEALTFDELKYLMLAIAKGEGLHAFADTAGFASATNIRLSGSVSSYRYVIVNNPDKPTLFFKAWQDEYFVCSLNEAKAGKLTE